MIHFKEDPSKEPIFRCLGPCGKDLPASAYTGMPQGWRKKKCQECIRRAQRVPIPTERTCTICRKRLSIMCRCKRVPTRRDHDTGHILCDCGAYDAVFFCRATRKAFGIASTCRRCGKATLKVWRHSTYGSQWLSRYNHKHRDKAKARESSYLAKRAAWRRQNYPKRREHHCAIKRLNELVRKGTVERPDRCQTCGVLCKPAAFVADWRRLDEVKWLCHLHHRRTVMKHKEIAKGIIYAADEKQDRKATLTPEERLSCPKDKWLEIHAANVAKIERERADERKWTTAEHEQETALTAKWLERVSADNWANRFGQFFGSAS